MTTLFPSIFEAKEAPNLLVLPTSHKSNLYKRARANFMTKALIMPLIDLNSSLKRSYWRTYHCASVLVEESEFQIDSLSQSQKFTSKYCNGRWCLVCNRIRTAKLIKGYEEALENIENQHFVTLTIQNIPEHKLKQAIEYMYLTMRKVQKSFIYEKMPIIGIRKLECTHSSARNDYHPHYHFLIEGNRKDLIDKWIQEINKHNYFYADRRGQEILQADSRSKKELFKYFTKLMTTKKDDKGQDLRISSYALDQIFQAIEGKRVFQSMGIKKFVEEDVKSIDLKVQEILTRSLEFEDLTKEELSQMENWEKFMKFEKEFAKYNYRKDWIWYQDIADWLDKDYNGLTKYSPSDTVLHFLSKIK